MHLNPFTNRLIKSPHIWFMIFGTSTSTTLLDHDLVIGGEARVVVFDIKSFTIMKAHLFDLIKSIGNNFHIEGL